MRQSSLIHLALNGHLLLRILLHVEEGMCSKIEILVYVDMLVHTARICRLKVKLMISSSTAQPSLLKSRECGSGRYLLRDILRLCNHYLGGLFLKIPLFR